MKRVAFASILFFSLAACAGEDDVKDMVCGMTISKKTAAATETILGETFYFCNKTCLKNFLSTPEQYLADAREVSDGRWTIVSASTKGGLDAGEDREVVVRVEPASTETLAAKLASVEISGVDWRPAVADPKATQPAISLAAGKDAGSWSGKVSLQAAGHLWIRVRVSFDDKSTAEAVFVVPVRAKK